MIERIQHIIYNTELNNMSVESFTKTELMSYGTRLTISTVLGSLLRELPSTLPPPIDGITCGLIPDLKSPLTQHKIRTKIFALPLTGEPQRISVAETWIDNIQIRQPSDLKIIGMDENQIAILENNVTNFNLLYETRKKFLKRKPKIIYELESSYSLKIKDNFGQPGNVFNMLSSMPQQDAFILEDTLGNIEGPYGSSLGSTMVGENAGNYHSVIVGAEKGFLPVPFVKIEDAQLRYYGELPEGLGEIGDLLQQGYLPIHPFNQKQFLDESKVTDAVIVNCYVLMSKRALVPVGHDFQIKTSLGLRILAGIRDIRFTQAQNGIENSRVLSKLAQMNKLPDKCLIIADKFAGQVKGDDHTTFMVRNKWREPIANIHNKTLPETAIPITAASLISKNILSPVPLLQDFAETGGDPIQLTRDIIKMVIETQLDLMDIGFVPEMHGQNTILLIDKVTKKLTGIMIRDHEGAKVDTEKMKKMKIDYNSVFNEAEDATSPLPIGNPELYKKLVTGYLHRFVMTGIITPLILTLNNRFSTEETEIAKLAQFAKERYMNWWKNNGKSFKEYSNIIAPGYYASSGTLSALGVKIYPSSRSTDVNPLIPTYQEMEEFLSK